MATFHERLAKSMDVEGETCTVTEGTSSGFVLVLFTGGTIGMKLNHEGVYVSEKDYLYSWLSKQPNFHDIEYSTLQRQRGRAAPFLSHFRNESLFLPVLSGRETKHIQYVIQEYTPVIDSSNMDFDGMLQIALDVKKWYKKFDGFVVLHGTDTMCYTAAALSFILENLGKPVILTGAQIPIYETRSDGRDNFMGALIMAGGFLIPEVCIFFDNKLFRGNRARKVSADTLDAFDSPNFPPLAKLEVSVTVYWDLVQRPSATKRFNVHTMLCENVAIWRIFPNMSTQIVRAFLRDPIQGVVMQSYGAGNFPDENIELLEVLKEACDRGVIIVNTTQCRRGTVSISYAGAKSLLESGVVAGYDMTSEAALAKLSYVLTKPWPLEEKRQFMSRNVSGELSTKETFPKHRNIGEALEVLGITTQLAADPEGLQQLRETLIMPLMCMAIKKSDLLALDKLVQLYPGNILMSDYDGRTPLHIAVRDGSYQVVNFLLNNGAPVHVRDSFSRCPLVEAVFSRRKDVIELLVKAGADLTLHPEALAIEMNQAAAQGDEELIRSFWSAGAKLDVWDYSGRTPLHVAVLSWHLELVQYLIQRGANPLITDDTSRTCMAVTCHIGLVQLLEEALVSQRWLKLKRKPSNQDTKSVDKLMGLETEDLSHRKDDHLSVPSESHSQTGHVHFTLGQGEYDGTEDNEKATQSPSVLHTS